MPDFASFVDFSSLFVALAGMLFAVWYMQFQALLTEPRPPMYRNRQAYIGGLQATIVAKAIPLVAFIAAYAVALSGEAYSTYHNTRGTLVPQEINAAATLFVLTYCLSLYLLALAVGVLIRLVAAWWRAGADRGSDAKVTFFR